MQPWFVTNELWFYLAITAISLTIWCGLLSLLVFYIERVWVSHLHREYSIPLDGIQLNVVAAVYYVVCILILTITGYLMEFGFTFGWLAIMCAAELFLATGSYSVGRDETQSPPPQMQADLAYLGITLDVMQAVLCAGTAVLFRNLVILK